MADLSKKLDPTIVKFNLSRAGLFLSAFEIMRGQLEGRLRGFFADDFKNMCALPSDEYRDEVLSRHKSSLQASLLWYVEMGVLNDSDVATIGEIRYHRNDIAHELPKYLFDPGFNMNLGMLSDMQRYIDTVSRFWARTWAEVDPQFDEVDLDSADIDSVASITMRYLMEVVSEASP